MSVDRDKEALAIGREMLAALERGRRLHPWKGYNAQVLATQDEAEELVDACRVQRTTGQSCIRIYDESVDAWVCARRAVEGK